MNGVFLDTETMSPGQLSFARLQQTGLQWQWHPWTLANETAERIAKASVVISNKVWIGAGEMDAAPQLKLICICATGTNNVDLQAARERHIVVCNVSGYAQGAVVQHTLALMLALATNWQRYQEACFDGRWPQSRMFCLLDFPVIELAGKTLGIVGFGSLGQQVANVARAFEMQVVVAQGPWQSGAQKGRLPWAEFLAQSDFISLHCPLSEQSRNLFHADTFRQMKSTAFLVNTARGGIVNEAELLQALRDGEIAGAALDVLSVEPPPADHILLQHRLPNLLLTPHSAWVSSESRQRLLDGVADNILAWQQGQPQNVVNR